MDEVMWNKLNQKVNVVGKALEGQGGDMNTLETSDDDLKLVLASCTRTSPTKRLKRNPKISPSKHPLTYTAGQTKLTSFLNMSVDDDFKDPRVSKPRQSSKADEILSQAQERTDKIQIAKLERRSKRQRKDAPGASKAKPVSKADVQSTTSTYFEPNEVVFILSSSDDDTSPVKTKRICTRIVPRPGERPLQEISDDTSNKLVTGDTVASLIFSNDTNANKAISDADECAGNKISIKDAPHDTAPHDTAAHDTAPHDTAPHDTAPHDAADAIPESVPEEASPNSQVTEASGDSDTDQITDLSTNSLLFSVSAHTDRIYFYDYSGQYLEVNCYLQDIVDRTSVPDLLKNNPNFLDSAQIFVDHWMSISKTTQTKLYNKIISDVDDEVKKLYEGRIVSTTRHFTGPEINNTAGAQTSNLVKTRIIKVGNEKVEIQQSFSENGKPLCVKCGDFVTGLSCKMNIRNESRLDLTSNFKLSKLPFQGRFCSLDCSKDYGVKSGSRCVRNLLFDLELGVCQLCGFDTEQFIRQLKLGESEERIQMLNSTHYKSLSDKQKKNIVENPTQGLFWQADHIVPVAEGGGECDIQNYRTLCTICHKTETKKLLSRLAVQRNVDFNKEKGIKDIRNFLG